MFVFTIRNNEFTRWIYRLRIVLSIAMGFAMAWCVKFLILMMAGSPEVIKELNYVPLLVGVIGGGCSLPSHLQRPLPRRCKRDPLLMRPPTKVERRAPAIFPIRCGGLSFYTSTTQVRTSLATDYKWSKIMCSNGRFSCRRGK